MFNAEFNYHSHKNKAFSYKTTALLSILTVLGISSPAEAFNLTRKAIFFWNFKGVTFNDGASAQRHFDYSMYINRISNVNVLVNEPIYNGRFDNNDVLRLSKRQGKVLALVDPYGRKFNKKGVIFHWAKPFTNKGVTIPISSGAYGKTKFTLPPFKVSKLSGGNIHAKPVPEPLTIIGTGFALGFGVLFKKKKGLSRDTN